MRVPRVAAKPSVDMDAQKCGPESLGWRRKPERDEPGPRFLNKEGGGQKWR
jgi:hypothetical protein